MKNVDWQDIRDRYRPAEDSDMPDQSLFQLMVEAMEPLEDAHTGIIAAAIKQRYTGHRSDVTPILPEQIAHTHEIVENRYIQGKMHRFCNDKVMSGIIQPGVLYVSYDGFMDFSSSGEYSEELQCSTKALNKIFSTSPTSSALIIDIRANDGGFDPLAIAFAGRLTRDTYLAYSKQARIGNPDIVRWSQAQAVFVTPSGNPGFFGPVILLTGPDSVSAAETFTMALMGRKPEVLRIGANTQGVFSDVLLRTLPNGWVFGLPNEQFLTADGLTYDGPGIPPHISVPVFSEKDLETGRDTALEKALSIINEGTATPPF